MNLHFIFTGGEFVYPYRLAIESALQTQKVETVCLLYIELRPTGEHFEAIKDKVQLQRIDRPEFLSIEKSSQEWTKYAHLKDYLTYKVLLENGGIVADLDTLFLKDISHLLRDKDLVVPLDAEVPIKFPYNSSILIAKKGSPILEQLVSMSRHILMQPWEVRWGSTGPVLISTVVDEHKDVVKVADFGVLGGFGGNEAGQIYEQSGKLRPNTHVLHMFAYAYKDKFRAVTPEYVKTSDSLYARLCRELLGNNDLEKWLARGQHYRPMFDWLEMHECRNIMEIGTHNGGNAVMMIKAAAKKVSEEEIAYWGFDLFENLTEEIRNKELSYPTSDPMKKVKAKIQKATSAKVKLTKGNTKATLWESKLPRMDLIYIDGGHSVETIRNDWTRAIELVKPSTGVIFLDDYIPDRDDMGCKFLCNEINESKTTFEVLPVVDSYPQPSGELLKSQLVMALPRVKRSPKASPHYGFHLLGLVHVPVSEKYMGCAFTQKIVKLSKMLLSLGHEVYLYGAETSDAPCTEFIQTHTLSDIRKAWGEGDNRFDLGYDWKVKGFKHDFNAPRTETTQKYYKACIEAINRRKRPDDFLLIMQGVYHKPVGDEVKLWLTCEPGIGYRGSYTRFRAFESAYLMNFMYGSEHPKESINGSYYDRVIPNYFDPKDFPFREDKEDFFFYMGRMIQRKGVFTALKAVEAIGGKLILAGQDKLNLNGYKCSEFVGYLESDQRADLMGRAKAVFVPTEYLEAFGGVNVEAQLCGTPAITTNFGVFPESIIQGVTGFRCNTLQDFVDAAKNVDKLDPKVIRKHAERYLMDNVRWEFQQWFDDLHQLYLSAQDKNVKGWHYLCKP